MKIMNVTKKKSRLLYGPFENQMPEIFAARFYGLFAT